MTRKEFLAAPLFAAAAAATASAAPGGNANYKAKRLNKAIELLADDQPVFHTGGRGGYEEGLASCYFPAQKAPPRAKPGRKTFSC